jgi:hypothetical protein
LGIPPIPSCRIRRILAVGSSVEEERVSKATVMVVLHRGSSKAVGSGRRYLLSPNHRDEPDWTRTIGLRREGPLTCRTIRTCSSTALNLFATPASRILSKWSGLTLRRISLAAIELGYDDTVSKAIRICVQTLQDVCDALFRRAAMTASTTASNAFPS